MARKQFVSSKKNAPSRAVSSKEAALQGRHPSAGDVDSDDDHSGDEANSPGSDVSSAPSSPISSDDEDGAVSDDGETAADPADSDRENDSAPPVTVQVMPASVGRGKQLRFPTGISRGKEVRPFKNGSDREGSDSESYASLASDEEDEPQSGGEEDVAGETPSTVKSSVSAPLSPPSKPESRKEPLDEEISYPIKAARARKRHRPDSGYFSQMSTHVRDCLLSVRDSATAPEVFRDDVHDDFRRKLSNGTVERVQWKAASPPPASEASSKSEKKPPKSRSETDSRESRRSEKAAKNTAVKEESKAPDSPTRDTTTSTTTTADKQKSASSSSASRKRERPSEDKESRQSSPVTATTETSAAQEPKERRRSSHTDAESNGTRTSGHSPAEANAFVCIKCQSKGDGQDQPDSAKEAAPASTTAPTPTQPPPVTGSFTVPTGPIKDIKQLQTMVSRLEQEARSLKHEGNRRGQVDPGPRGQVAQGVYFLRSSAKFFQQALLLADMKAAFIELGDERSARSRGDNCIMMLGQTTSLIRSTVSAFHAAGNRRLVALGYKFASIVHLTIYRLRHQRVFAYYSDLSAPSRSPDSRTNGTTPPIAGSSNSSADAKEAAIKALIVKEMEHTMRGFEMWQRYESLQVEVLPRITNPAIVDLTAFLDDLAQELDKSE